MKTQAAIKAINKHGVLLVFPINNHKEPLSLWHELHPKSKMSWKWTDEADNKVFAMWRLMKKLSSSREVVYSKWYKGRATFFSRELFCALLYLQFSLKSEGQTGLQSGMAATLLDILESDSPISTKRLKALADLQGKLNEPVYQKSLKELFANFLVVAFGEIDDGAFPSNALGATNLIYEDLWIRANELNQTEAMLVIDKFMPMTNKFRKFLNSNLKGV